MPDRVSYVVRHHITHPRHLERYFSWMKDEQEPALRVALPDLAVVRHYRAEKEDKYFVHFYEFREGVAWGPSLERGWAAIRESWYPFSPDLRDFSGIPFAEIWRGGEGLRTSGPHPLTLERLSVVSSKEAAWNAWCEGELWPGYIHDLGVPVVRRRRALTGDPRFYLQGWELEDVEAMRANVERNEPAKRPKFWNGWAAWMPYIENLTRWIFFPVDLAQPPEPVKPASA